MNSDSCIVNTQMHTWAPPSRHASFSFALSLSTSSVFAVGAASNQHSLLQQNKPISKIQDNSKTKKDSGENTLNPPHRNESSSDPPSLFAVGFKCIEIPPETGQTTSRITRRPPRSIKSFMNFLLHLLFMLSP